VVIDYLDFVGIAALPHKTHPELIVDPDAVLPCPLEFQLLQTISWWGPKVLQSRRSIQHVELPSRNSAQVRRRSAPTLARFPEHPGIFVGKSLDHIRNLLFCGHHVKRY